MGMVEDDTVVLDNGTGIDYAVLSDNGMAIDYGSCSDECSSAYLRFFRYNSAGMNNAMSSPACRRHLIVTLFPYLVAANSHYKKARFQSFRILEGNSFLALPGTIRVYET